MSAVTLGEALAAGRARVGATDAAVLLRHVLSRDAAFFIAHPETLLRGEEHNAYVELVQRRARGEPVSYLVGEREFYGKSLKVSPAVLIPRPETELLVDLALERLPRDAALRVLDLGTGSGCIALAIASERSQLKVLATDQSDAALAVARQNAMTLRVGNASFLRSDWYSALADDFFDLIVCNPPYVAADDPHLAEGDLRYEPRAALVAEEDGLACLRQVIAGAARHLVRGGWVIVEHAFDQASRVRSLFASHGYAQVFSARDLAGLERATAGRLTT